MKKLIVLLAGITCYFTSLCQRPYWQQELHYRIDVTLNDTEHSLDGFMKLEYRNLSPDTLTFIWFHLWPNAYKNDKTAFSEQMLENGRTDFYFSNKESRGYINHLDFRTDNSTLKTEDHPQYIDVVKVYLTRPLAPGEQTTINTPFHVQLPYNFSRGGHVGQSYQITQWYPKPAVYDRDGWHPMPYLDQGEFYSEFGSYEVHITLPSNYVVAATGELQNEEEKKWLDSRVHFEMPVKPKAPTAKKGFGKPMTTELAPIPSSPQTKTLEYRQDKVHDFAWFADKTYRVAHDTLQLTSGRIINAYSFYWPRDQKTWGTSTQLIKDAIRFRSRLIGEYPFNTASVVEAKMGFDGGMEYPTITSISPVGDTKSLDLVIEHELGHNWFYGILASNERNHPWMDEGLNSYYDARYEKEKYTPSGNPSAISFPENVQKQLIHSLAVMKKDQAIETPSAEFTNTNYGLIAYYKTALWCKELETFLGKEKFDSCLQQYYSDWKFKHPQPQDLISTIEKTSGQQISAFTAALSKTGTEKGKFNAKKKTKLSLLPRLADTDKNRYLNLLPLPGYNHYDGFQLGVAVHNYNLPPVPFQFFLLPQYAFKSQQMNGIGRLGYTWRPEGKTDKIEAALGGEKYSYLSGVDSNGKKIAAGFYKFTPSVRIYFRPPSLRSSREKWLEWKTYLIGERNFDYKQKSTDSLYYPIRGAVSNRYLNQITYTVTDYRALYPFDVRFQIQQAADFYRINIGANYFLNYAKGGGASVRFFAAKFGYVGGKTASKEFATAAYQPKLTAVRGNEDYTYSNYFFGRNESDGGASQQIMLRDGGLKLRTDLFQGLQGRSENWIAAVNLNTTLPAAIIPRAIPLKLFLDAGTYAEAWKKNATVQRFLFVGGLQLTLFKDILNIYAPLVYSKEFSDNLKTVPEENKFLRKISFSIDLQKINLRRITENKIPF